MKNVWISKYGAIIITLISILVTGMIFKQNPFLMLPLIISLFIMMTQAQVNRFGYLLGGLNSILYGAVYLYLGVYATAANALLVSFPIQIITFFNWRKKAYKKSVVLKKLSTKMRVIVGVVFAISWCIVFKLLSDSGSRYAALDCTASVVGIFTSFLIMFTYMEYSYFGIVNGISNLLLNVQLVRNTPQQMPYLVYAIYVCYCMILTYNNVKRLYKEQSVSQN